MNSFCSCDIDLCKPQKCMNGCQSMVSQAAANWGSHSEHDSTSLAKDVQRPDQAPSSEASPSGKLAFIYATFPTNGSACLSTRSINFTVSEQK